MKHIGLFNDKIILTFRFDPAIVATIRKIDGRIWNAKDKRWELPKENVVEVLATLVPLGFTASLDVINLKEREEKELAAIHEIKTATDAKYEGALPLYDFQRKGAMFLKQMPHALLGDVPGLGKTLQTIAATEQDKHVLLFTMNTLKFTTADEVKKWLPNERVLVIDGDKKHRAEQWTLHAPKNRVVVANYELLVHDFDLIKQHEWHTIVCDEATRISNPDAITTRNLKLLRSHKRIALTGTPISNSPDDIYSIIDWLVPKYLGTFYQFRDKYCIVDDRFNRVTGYKNMDELSKKVDRFMLRRTKEEVFTDFPPKTIENVVFHLSVAERKLYTSIKEQVLEEIRELSELDTRTLGIIPVKMLRLKQCTDHPRLVGIKDEKECSKLDTLKALLKPVIDSGEKAIIFTQFAEMLHILKDELKEYRPITIFGDVDSVDRMVRVKEFNDDPKPRIIIMTEAGAYGLNMQSASYVVHYDAPWSIAKLMQREDRAHRIGQNKPVTVYNLIAKDTIDEYILKVLSRKNKVSVDILKDAERLGEQGLSKEDIDEILRL
jgi:SNF2 family DNA or RNA helicase